MNKKSIYQTIIIGAGPAGCAAAVYCARKKIKTLLITESFGGQSVVSSEIENWLGEIKISGEQLAKKLEQHVRSQKDIDIVTSELVKEIEKENKFFKVVTNKNKIFQTQTIIIASGGHHRPLKVPGEKEFNGKGVSYCSTCDAPFFKNKDVVVVGTGNSGLGAVLDLIPYAKKIYVMDILDKIQGDQILQDKIKRTNKQIKYLLLSKVKEIIGDKFIKAIRYQDKNNNIKTLELQGIFVEIGMLPNSGFVKNLVELDKWLQIKVDQQTKATSQPGIFAAGDVTNLLFRQNNIAAGDGVIAALSVYDFLMKDKR